MKIIVTHMSPDWDAITSVWLLKKYLAGWQEAQVQFVPAGQRLERGPVGRHPTPMASFADAQSRHSSGAPTPATPFSEVVEYIGKDEVIHVDTGLGPLDHHQTQDTNVCGASRTWDYVQEQLQKTGSPLTEIHAQAVSRVIQFVIETDHFKEVFWADPAADYHEFSLLGLLEGLKQVKQNQDMYYVTFGIECLEAMVATFENRIWAETEIADKGIPFETRFGKGLGFETLNDTVLKLAQKMGYVIVVRKDPRKGYVRIKTKPLSEKERKEGLKDRDLTLAYEQFCKIDPDATWFLHVSKKMLLNGTPKNPKMKPTKLKLGDIIKVLEKM